MPLRQQFRRGVPPAWGGDLLEGESLKSATTTRVGFVELRAFGLELRMSLLPLRRVGLAAKRRWELALWTLNPAIAVQIRVGPYLHREA